MLNISISIELFQVLHNMAFLKRIQVTLDADSGTKKVCDTGIKVQTLFKVGDVAKYNADLVPNLGRYHLFKNNMNKVSIFFFLIKNKSF